MCELEIKTEWQHHMWRLLPLLKVPGSANGSGVWGERFVVQMRVEIDLFVHTVQKETDLLCNIKAQSLRIVVNK